ncbi:hypothetical protein SARC_13861 [Sphaeroforma arctica JP610]|uniref:Uncharacterized protein n=1 Tax=Sphaeroforma arctica JP610 TaxID=667725 RepID=A0A0L0FAQ8_9EUKA|nr:hypothetical protein SARC_13861 [Sphaeroforma arctica JP610]KNC73581.1 hypothetical protein SARC_13861 [Sphaeroforma arctica JP610]|eukprot:XP_014147483.1 hypothetical protein SARC_13861 [Sphaeroforma arctica JP610]
MQPSIPPHPPSSAVRNGSVPVPRPPKTKPPTAKNSSSIALTNIYGGTTSAEKVIPQLESALFAQRQLLEELYTPPAGGDSAVVPIEQPPLLSPAERICQEVIDKLQKLLAEVKEDARS